MIRQILILIITALVLFFSYGHMSKEYCPSCCDASAGPVIRAAKATGPLLFNWNSAETITNEEFPGLRDEILAEGAEGEAIVITGHYFADEANDTAYENLGLARACLLYTSPSPRDRTRSRMPSSA